MPERAPLRIAFTNIPRRLWAGGHNYQRNLFEALNRHAPGSVTPVLFAGTADDSEEIAALAGIPAVEVVRSPVFDHAATGLARATDLARAIAFGLDGPAIAEFRTRKIDMVFESARFFGWRLPFPAIAWFPDFQHRLLPHLFSRSAYWRRDLGFRIQLASGRHVMLSSASALGDLKRFYPGLSKGVSVVRFATEPPASLLATNPSDVIASYGLPPRYFYLPNQFWRHKNHQLVVDALDLLKRRGLGVVVAASGSTLDFREPGRFEAMMQEVKARGLETNFRHLGMIPLDHVYALLRASAALINPSECEGWSTTVEEAKSFGVPMLLSGLEVHREQTEGRARYFAIRDAEALADHMSQVARSADPGIVRDLLPNLDERVKAFVADFVRLTADVMQGARSR
ncbi:glycosyltransferase involved in cell wall biosynthesis [Bradyrhizobium japonicum USDA 38]|uniref:glycosyltransferase family 4 protein n=1 Tax=Bradyrhizobium japonicum TaxID=375 RepID=UPI0004822E30|nr:glycosyltransferase family 1 protein [Bradyrhizobium japonicum]MCS3894552.1 glycosyltransferase involved in cell wall biosynthesis [Bradyrhizobium japonicum USDA 38]MCS3947066.1 glycosyltransferase involved in cell wall biosynthesis [Bradyrhizobium japonicum]MCW2220103.1 glycosyltransferase involved in cell wall biosynthesis [Bradyrhizobium japonicum]MCW2344717.1 glycosyltransferase involved in cell wall biosynthesis [Bradyrhizobium japonicum]